MIIKYGSLFVYNGTSLSDGEWLFSNVTVFKDNTLKIDIYNKSELECSSRTYHLSPEWNIITQRRMTVSSFPPLPENKKQDGLFALTKPPEITIWLLASSKYERDTWMEKILPLVTLRLPASLEPPPPYSEYDNLSYFPWDNSTRTETVGVKDQRSFTLPRPALPSRSGFYSLEKPIRKPPKPGEPTLLPEPPPPSEPLPRHEQSRQHCECTHCMVMLCVHICDILGECCQMCGNNFTVGFL